MSKESCNLEDYNWSEDTLLNVVDGANQGIPTAIEELKRREKELGLSIIDTVSAKALSVEWIQE
jgi:hypothetical protein